MIPHFQVTAQEIGMETDNPKYERFIIVLLIMLSAFLAFLLSKKQENLISVPTQMPLKIEPTQLESGSVEKLKLNTRDSGPTLFFYTEEDGLKPSFSIHYSDEKPPSRSTLLKIIVDDRVVGMTVDNFRKMILNMACRKEAP